jgi:hypothetical protein
MQRTAVTTACTVCGTTATVPPPYTWSVTVEGSSRSWTCAPCSRDHLPSIEARAGGQELSALHLVLTAC